jgi:hypothetical protein
MKNIKLCHFSFRNLLHTTASLNIPSPGIHAAEMVEVLDENSKRDSTNFVQMLQT